MDVAPRMAQKDRLTKLSDLTKPARRCPLHPQSGCSSSG